jgi:transcriptional regulator with XRE-family HTH domain
MAFHENLRTLRLARNLTQPALAEKADIEQS